MTDDLKKQFPEFFQKPKDEPEEEAPSTEPPKDVRMYSAIAQLVENINRRLTALENRFSGQPHTQTSWEQSKPLSEAPSKFDDIKSFAEAMRSLKSYENEVIESYQKQQDEAKSILQAVYEEMQEKAPAEGQSVEDAALMAIVKHLGSGGAPRSTVPTPPPNFQGGGTVTGTYNDIVPNPEVKNVTPKDIEIIKQQIPDFMKQQIKSGTFTLRQAIDKAIPFAKRQGINLSERDVEEIYNSIKNEGGAPMPEEETPAEGEEETESGDKDGGGEEGGEGEADASPDKE